MDRIVTVSLLSVSRSAGQVTNDASIAKCSRVQNPPRVAFVFNRRQFHAFLFNFAHLYLQLSLQLLMAIIRPLLYRVKGHSELSPAGHPPALFRPVTPLPQSVAGRAPTRGAWIETLRAHCACRCVWLASACNRVACSCSVAASRCRPLAPIWSNTAWASRRVILVCAARLNIYATPCGLRPDYRRGCQSRSRGRAMGNRTRSLSLLRPSV